ncbi:MAG: amino acid ABC transporter substrate-binding protein [Rubrivivax sp.]|nr:MAG: amino acid ABC transporter substrate-binding protein [Rubrivivax sp.]
MAGLIGGRAALAADVPVVRYPAPQSPLDNRSLDLINLLAAALRRTVASHGPVRLEESEEVLTELRQFAELNADRGSLHVTWATPSAQRQTRARPVLFDARRGLLGMRISLIDQRRLDELAKVTDLASLRRFTIGQGLAWPDVDVFEASGLKVFTVSGYENLFRMLLVGRFDLFPRGVGEVFGEFDARHASMPRLAVDPSLLLVYPYPYHYYFAPSQSALAARVEAGLLAMKADGSFEAHLWRHHGASVARAGFSKRRVLHLRNPNLPPEAERDIEANLAWWMKTPSAYR